MERRIRGWDVVREGVMSVVRTTRRYPGFTVGVVLTLGLGIGANATMYGIVDRLLLQPPEHIVDHERVKLVYYERLSFMTGEPTVGSTLTYPDFTDLQAHDAVEVAAYTLARSSTVGRGEDAYQVQSSLVSAEFFPLLGVQPRVGRFFGEDEDAVGAQLVAVLGEEYWTRAFGADPNVLGQTLEIEGRRTAIIGVAPRGFTGTHLASVDVWLPIVPTHAAQRGDFCLTSRGCWWMQMVARLNDDVSMEAAEAQATALHLAGRREMIDADRYSEEARIVLGPVIAADGPEASDEARVARWLAAVSAIVLLIACANVANLLMARSLRQRRETGVRLALGASRRRVVGQTMVEAVSLALLGGVLALVIARWGGGLLRAALLPGVYFPNEAWSVRLLAFTGGAALLAGIVAGLGPALQSRRTDVSGALAGGGRGASGARSRAQSSLTVLQAAMSVVLLVGAGLFVRSLAELRSLDLGLDVDDLLLARLEFVDSDIEPDEQTAQYEEALRRIERLPGVRSTAATGVPFMWAEAEGLRVPGVDSLPRLPGGGPYRFPVSSKYFETVGLEVVRGRAVLEWDVADAEKVAVVSETMARLVWPESDALGECMLVMSVGTYAEQCTTVVGVVEDAARGGYLDEEFMAYYLPAAQMQTHAYEGAYIRTAGDPRELVEDVSIALRSFSPRVRFATVEPLRETLDPQARAWTLGAMMFSLFGLLALCLAAIGLYSVLIFDVAQRTRELGIRSALGARKAELLRSVLVQAGRLVVAGVLLGGATAWLAAPLLGDLLFQVSPRDPWTLATVAALLLAVSAVASLVPGLRATSVDPLVALRAE